MHAKLNFITRIQSLVRTGTTRHGVIRPSDINFVKMAKPGTPQNIEETIRDILKWSYSQACRKCTKAIEKDKAWLIKELGDKAADPSPLPSTLYATEALRRFSVAQRLQRAVRFCMALFEHCNRGIVLKSAEPMGMERLTLGVRCRTLVMGG